MSVRFRIRTTQGQEISFASHEMFAEFVRSGDLSPDDVVYDAETHEWSSSRTHPVVLQIESDREDEAEESGVPDEALPGAAEVAAEPSEPPAAEGLELTPAQEQLTPQQAGAAFVKKMEAERASDLEFDEEPAIQGFKMEKGSSGLLGDLTEAPELRPPAAAPPRAEEPRREEPRTEVAPRREETRRDAPTRSEPPAKPPKRKRSGAGRKYAPLVIVAAVVTAGGIYFGPEVFSSVSGGAGSNAPDSVALPPTAAPLIPDTEEALRARAQERFLTSTRALLRDLPPIPAVWLQGAYLAAPSDYPQVRTTWNTYLTTIRQVRAGDDERYRAGYLRALEDARVEGSARTLRLAGAVSAFQGRVGLRAAHYDRVEALATAALRGHDALIDAEGTIAYEPVARSPVSGDPVIEAVGRNAGAQALLDQVLDMILRELNGPGGPTQASNVGEWIWNGILNAVTN